MPGGWDQEEKIASIAVPLRSEQRVIGCLNLVYMASAMTIEQAAEKHLPALQRVAKQIEEGVGRSCRCCVWCRTHSRLIGKHTALKTVSNRLA